MLLHEAVKKARKDLRLSQKSLADLAGIQRKQLATLETGGNITLATKRKVLAHLPNLETFSLGAVTAMVRRQVPPEEQFQAVKTVRPAGRGDPRHRHEGQRRPDPGREQRRSASARHRHLCQGRGLRRRRPEAPARAGGCRARKEAGGVSRGRGGGIRVIIELAQRKKSRARSKRAKPAT
jgi:transcriptional regulator with XRE-family HTH domain